jgi:transcriptional regulator with XRE-family HTH domain
MSVLRRLRIDRAMTVEDLSQATGVKVSTIYNLERGDIASPRISTLVPLAEFFQIKPSALVPSLSATTDDTPEAA